MRLAKQLIAVAIIAGAICGSQSRPAFAHAVLVDANPSIGSILTAAPKEVKLTFDDNLIQIPGQETNVIEVQNQSNVEVDFGDTSVDGAEVTVSLQDLPSGIYTVTYRVLSADGHPVSNRFQFKVSLSTNADQTQKKPTASPKTTAKSSTPQATNVSAKKQGASDKSPTSKPTSETTSASSSAQSTLQTPKKPLESKSAAQPSSSANDFPWLGVFLILGFVTLLVGLWIAFLTRRSKG